jgi:hypothetical protein
VAASLAVVSDALTRHGIWHTLAYGTLLGAVRERDIISWDHDFDLFVRPRHIPRILALNGALASHGLEIGQLRYPGSVLAMNPGAVAWFDPMHLQVRLEGEYIGDLFMPSLFADGILRIFDFATDVYWTPHFSIPHFLLAETGTAMIRDRTYPAMAHAEAFLTLMYGASWRVPYRSVVDGGEPAAGLTTHSHRYRPRLRAAIAQAEALGWDRQVYRGLPAWPRRVAGAGPIGPTDRTRFTSGALWWHDLEELVAEY